MCKFVGVVAVVVLNTEVIPFCRASLERSSLDDEWVEASVAADGSNDDDAKTFVSMMPGRT